jgi:hypothetical protein
VACFRIAAILGYTPFVQIEHSLIGAFVKRSKRDRDREILSNPRLRQKFIRQLAHFRDFDPQCGLSSVLEREPA